MDFIDKTTLREKAEERVKFLESVPEDLNKEQLLKLAHELQVYKIELEIQNEELLKAQERINTSLERFYSLFHNAPVGYLICNEVGIITKANATFYYMTKIEDNVVGKAVVDFLVDEDRELLLSRYKAFFKNPLKKQIEVRLKTTRNTHLCCRLEGRIFSIKIDDKEQYSELLISFADVTETKRANKILTESEKQLSTLINNMPDIVCFKDGNGRWLVANEFDLNLFQLTNIDYKNKKDSELAQYSPFYKDAFMNCEDSDEMTWQVGKSTRVEEVIAKPDGSELVFDIIKVPTFNDDGSRKGLIVLGRDITERKKAEEKVIQYQTHLEDLIKVRTEELNKTNIELKESIEKEHAIAIILKKSLDNERELNILKSKFISTTSHEFRTPLTSILSSAQMIQKYSDKWDETKKTEHLNRIQNSVNYLSKILDDVSTLNKVDDGENNFTPKQIDLYSICCDCTHDATALQNERHKIILKYISETKEYFLDPKLIRFIINNLLSNAIKYSPNGGEILFMVKQENGNLIIEIQDMGIGIPQEALDKIYDSFYRATNAETLPGTGLGLSIVKRAVELHQGSISVVSKLDKGTTFTVVFPIDTSKN